MPAVSEEASELEGFPQYAEKVMTDWTVPGMAVGVIKDGDVLYSRGFGYRDVGNQLPVTSRTLFAIGSSTKAFTAMALGMLVDDGKLNLDTPLIEYLPDFRLYDDYATLHATPRDILCHRTGVPGYDALWILSKRSRDDFYRRLRHLQPSAGFREVFKYNNLMYMVAGILVGHLSGSSWEEFVAEHIFVPLDMKHSNFRVLDSQKTDDFAQPYFTLTGEQTRIPFRVVDATAPGGSINSTAADMTQWLLLHLNKGKAGERQLVSEASLAQTHLPNMVISDPFLAKLAQAPMYGQGWYISDYRGHPLIEHGGNIDGFSAVVSLLPEDNIGVVVLSNSMNIMGHAIARDIYDRLLNLEERDWNSHYRVVFGEILKGMSGGAAGKEPKAGTQTTLPIPDYSGSYDNPAFGRVHVMYDSERLTAQFQSGLTSELHHFHFDVFKGATTDVYLPAITVRFHVGNDGAVESFSMPLESGVEEIDFTRSD